MYFLFLYKKVKYLWINSLCNRYGDSKAAAGEAETLLWFVSGQVGRLQCPLLLVVGEDDQVLPSHESAMDVSIIKWQHPVQINSLQAENFIDHRDETE